MSVTTVLLSLLVVVFVLAVIICCVLNIMLERERDLLLTEISRNRELYEKRFNKRNRDGMIDDADENASLLSYEDADIAAYREEMHALRKRLFEVEAKNNLMGQQQKNPDVPAQSIFSRGMLVTPVANVPSNNSEELLAQAEELTQRENEIKVLRGELASSIEVKEQLKSLQSKMERESKKYNDLETEKKEQVAKLEEQLQALENSSDPDVRVNQLRDDLASERKKMADHVAVCEHDADDLRRKITEAVAENKTNQRNYGIKLKDLEDQIAKNETNVALLKKKHADEVKSMQATHKMKNTMQMQQLAAAKANANRTAATNLNSNTDNGASQAELDTANKTLAKVKDSYKALKADMQAQTASKDNEIASLKKQLEASGKGGNAQVKAISKDLDLERKKVVELSKDTADKKLQIQKLTKELTALKESTSSATSQNDALTRNLKQAEDKAKMLQTNLTGVSKEVEELNKKLKQFKSKEIPALSNDEIKALQNNLRMKEGEVYTLTQQKTKELKEKSDFQTQLGIMTEKFNAAEAKIAELEKDIAQLREDSSAHLKDEIAKVEAKFGTDMAEIKSSMEAAQAEQTRLQGIVDEQEAMLADTKALIEEKDEAYALLEADRDHVAEYFAAEQKRRKKFQLEIEGLKGKVRVYCRVRPFNKNEIKKEETKCIREGGDMWSLELNNPKADIHGKMVSAWTNFSFDQVFLHGRNGTQEEVFEDCQPFSELAYAGVNTCIFAYGQSGTGKTYTMAGAPGAVGLKPRMLQYLFQMKEESRFSEVTISAYMVEIYLNKLEDVFWKVEQGKLSKDKRSKTPPELKIRTGKNNKVVVQGVTEIEFKDAQQAVEYCDAAELKRRVRKTGLNEASSRSHLVFAIMIKNKDLKTNKTTKGKLSLVDLAGSERADKTNVDGLKPKEREEMVKEGTAINQSLQQLKNVFRILGSNESNVKGAKKEIVVYRGNTLTELMQDSLGGSARTLMFVNVGPAQSNVEESLDSLRYSTFVNNIKNEIATADSDFSEERAKLNNIIEAYKAKFGEIEIPEAE